MESRSNYSRSASGSSSSRSNPSASNRSPSESSSRGASGRAGQDGLGRRVAQGVSRALESVGWGQQVAQSPHEQVQQPREHENYQRHHQYYQYQREQQRQQQSRQSQSHEQQRQPQHQQHQSHRRSHTLIPPILRPPALPKLSAFSTPAVPDSGWASKDFMLGVGMVIIQEDTHKIVMVWEKEKRYWFFPRGRKDVGESLEVAARREGYEESGYTPEFMPHYANMHQPRPPSHTDGQYTEPTCEPIFVTLMHWSARARKERDGRMYVKPGGEYLITWFLGKIASDAVRQQGTGMEDEQNYEAHLVPYEKAVTLLAGSEQKVLKYAWEVYTMTLECQEYLAQQKREQEQQQQQPQGYDVQESVEIPEIRSEEAEDGDVLLDGAGSRGTEERRSLGGTRTLSVL